VTGWILTRPDRRSTDAQLRPEQVLANCPHLDATARHVAAFAELPTGLEVDRLDDWVAAVEGPTTSRRCTRSRPGSSATTTRCATGCAWPTAPARSRAP
jgi:hypothetical protein